MAELYGKKRSQIQQALTTAQNNATEIEIDIDEIIKSLKRFHKQNTNAYKYTIDATTRLKQLQNQIDNLAALALGIEEQWSQYCDEALYWEGISEQNNR